MELSRAKRNFTCTHCNREFRRLEHLQRHSRTHTKEKPFTCHCGDSFSRNDLLKRHSRIAHPPPPTHASTSSGVALDALYPDNSGSLAQLAFLEGHPDGTVIVEASLSGQDPVRRALSLPLPPEYRHVEEAFRTKNGGNALHELLQDLLEDTKSPADRLRLNQSATAASSNDISAFVPPAQSRFEVHTVLSTRHVTPHGPWCDSGLGGLAGMRQHLVQSLLRHGRTAEPLPSDQSLSRYIHAFLGGFHERYPVFHTQTMPLTDLPADLAFALLAIGADSCLETKAALYLFESAVSVSPERLGQRKKYLNAVFATHDKPSVAAATPALAGEDSWLDESSHVLCTMTLLTAFALQNRSPHAMRVMWYVQGVVAHELRQSLSLCDPQEEFTSEHPAAWSEWARRESRRRVKHTAFCALNLVSLTFDFPAAVRFEQLHVAVPCSAEQWDASSPEQWLQARKRIQPRPLLLSNILEASLNGGGDIAAPFTALGDFTILHAILQRIQTIRQVLPVVPEDIQTNLECVVIAVFFCPSIVDLTLVRSTFWAILTGNRLNRSSLSSLARADSVPNYPQGLAVYALSGVAYTQLHLAIGQCPSTSQDARQLATRLHRLPPPARSHRVFAELRCAAHLLSEQVSTGLGMRNCPLDVANDPQGLLCTVTLSIFLVKWLLLMADIDHEQTVTEDEQQIIQSVGDVVQEARRCIELETLCDREDLPSIAIGVLEIMIHIFQRSHREHINLVGNAFGLYATMLRIPGQDPDLQANADYASGEIW